MNFTFHVLRRKNASESPRWEMIPFQTENENETVATALTKINETAKEPIRWECSCLQKKCGACAMVINGRPQLACDTFLKAWRKKGEITLEPLHKFPVVADLIVDRSILQENLKTLGVWAEAEVSVQGEKRETAYQASRCLQCGCCLEICPNVCPGGAFFGGAAFVPAARLMEPLKGDQKKELARHYREHVYEGCGKSLACADICPAGIDLQHLLTHANASAVWKKK